ncbi:MAG: hypothetical protein KJI72_01335 [Patescibacteria group bacterium]|nr:hypothetical protein [Patescibacteria group bacterium]
MIENIRAIIFDWGRTIYDKENERLFPETKEVLEYASKKHPLAVVSLAIDDDIEGRFEKMDEYDIRKYFRFALFHISDKDSLFRNAFGNFKFKPEEILVIDDIMRRLQFPIAEGCKTIWIQRGKFANELPNETTGYPTVTVKSLKEATKFF